MTIELTQEQVDYLYTLAASMNATVDQAMGLSNRVGWESYYKLEDVASDIAKDTVLLKRFSLTLNS